MEDVKRIFATLFSNVDIVDWSISGHAHLFEHSLSGNNKVLSHMNWRMFSLSTVRAFHTEYDTLLQGFDGFIVTHSPIFVMLYERYQKPVIVVNSCRYHQPLCWTKNKWLRKAFHDCLERLHAKRLLTIVHNNVADMRFFHRHVSLDMTSQYYIPSLCTYIQTSYHPERRQILLDDRHQTLQSFGFRRNDPSFLYPLDPKPSPFEWTDLCTFQAVLVIPTEVSFMTFFEYLYACIPLLLPSRTLLEAWIRSARHRMGTLLDYHMQHEEDLSKDWLPYADYYYDPEIQHCMLYFESIDHLYAILRHPHLVDILAQKHHVLQECQRRRQQAILRTWNDIFHLDFFQFVCYNFWPCLADFHLDVDYDKHELCTPFYRYNPIHPDSMRDNDLVFVKTDLLPLFMNTIRPHIRTTYRLLVAVSDMSPSNVHITALVNDTQCTNVYATNVVQQHPKITPLPIGFAEPLRPNGDVTMLRRRFVGRWRSHKDVDLLVRHFNETHRSRHQQLSQLSRLYGHKRFSTIVRLQESVPPEEMHTYLGRARFALCLRGNGLDTHFVYECIVNECVPLIWQSPTDPDPSLPLYDDMPCILFRDPDELSLSKDRLDVAYDTIDWDVEKIKLLREHYKYLKSC